MGARHFFGVRKSEENSIESGESLIIDWNLFNVGNPIPARPDLGLCNFEMFANPETNWFYLFLSPTFSLHCVRYDGNGSLGETIS